MEQVCLYFLESKQWSDKETLVFQSCFTN